MYWIDLDEKFYVPYDKQDLNDTKKQLDNLSEKSIAPSDLPSVTHKKFFDAVIRHQDMIDLFDTTPDISGNHIDVSRFVRNMRNNLDVSVFWRDKIYDKFKPERDEICNVSLNSLRTFLKNKNQYGYIWNYADEKWTKVFPKDILPGQIIMLDSTFGGYSSTYGWDETVSNSVEMIGKPQQEPISYGDDKSSQSSSPVTLDDHTRHVMDETEHFLKNISHLDEKIKDVIRIAVKYHDVGKAHVVFQEAMRKGIDDKRKGESDVWAKSCKGPKYSRSGFRHEVVSALAYLKQKDQLDDKIRNLVAYLIISHHGKVRLSLRTISKRAREQKTREYLLGIKIDGDELPKFTGKSVSIEKTDIDMSMANIGRDKDGNPSWTERAITLRNEYGPFRLTYLEMLVRRSDWLASAKENKVNTNG